MAESAASATKTTMPQVCCSRITASAAANWESSHWWTGRATRSAVAMRSSDAMTVTRRVAQAPDRDSAGGEAGLASGGGMVGVQRGAAADEIDHSAGHRAIERGTPLTAAQSAQ
jgi:hypothetical protein